MCYHCANVVSTNSFKTFIIHKYNLINLFYVLRVGTISLSDNVCAILKL